MLHEAASDKLEDDMTPHDETVGGVAVDLQGNLEAYQDGLLRGWAVGLVAGAAIPLLPVRVRTAGGAVVDTVAAEYRADVAAAGQGTAWAGFGVYVEPADLSGILTLEAEVGGLWREVTRVDGAALLAVSPDVAEPTRPDIESILLAFARAGTSTARVQNTGCVLGGSIWVQASAAAAGRVELQLRLEPEASGGEPRPILSTTVTGEPADRVDLRFRLAADSGNTAPGVLTVPVRVLGPRPVDVRLSLFHHDGRHRVGDFRIPPYEWLPLLAEIPAHRCRHDTLDPDDLLASLWLEVTARDVGRIDVGEVSETASLGGFESARVASQRHLLDLGDDSADDDQPRRRLSVVIPFHGAHAYTAHCVEAVRRTCGAQVEIVLVDDGSARGPASALAPSWGDDTRVVRFPRNRGYTAAVNAGVAAASHDVVIVLNNDTRPCPGWDLPLVAALDKPDVFAAGPLSNAASYQSVPKTRDGDRWAVNEPPPGLAPRDLAALLRREFDGTVVDWPILNGFCYAVRRDAFLELDGLDEAAFPRGYGEEVDLMLRARRAGLRNVVCPDSFVYHYKSRTFGADRDALSAAGQRVLRQRWGADLQDAVRAMDSGLGLAVVRSRLQPLLQTDPEVS